LRRKLGRPNVEVKIQEDFKALGGDTLRMLEEYIERCETVVHFAGAMAGSTPAPRGAQAPRIAEASNRWGIGELGRMSGRYKALFGELPSQTLRLRRTGMLYPGA
jgi:hypothetical protein